MGKTLVSWVYPHGTWCPHDMQGMDKTLVHGLYPHGVSRYYKRGFRGASLQRKSCSYLDFELVTQRRSGPNATNPLTHTNSTQDGDASEDDATFDNVRRSKRTAFWQPFRCSKPSSPIKCLHHISDGPGVRTQQYSEKSQPRQLKPGSTSPPVS